MLFALLLLLIFLISLVVDCGLFEWIVAWGWGSRGGGTWAELGISGGVSRPHFSTKKEEKKQKTEDSPRRSTRESESGMFER